MVCRTAYRTIIQHTDDARKRLYRTQDIQSSKKRLAVNHLARIQHSIFSDATPQAQDQVECRLLLNVVISESTTILQLLAGKN